jgi:hypothetical protein
MVVRGFEDFEPTHCHFQRSQQLWCGSDKHGIRLALRSGLPIRVDGTDHCLGSWDQIE